MMNKKMEKTEENSSIISFTVNGKLYTVSDASIETTLNQWLRSTALLTGTKEMCYEGGCGSCVVMVTRPDPVKGEEISFAVNSCLFPLLCLDGYHVVTTEGLVAEDGTYHSIQKRMAQFNATQCGYCTPGFVMTMYSMLKNNPKPTQEEIEKEFDGNICRCTGFRPILAAMKSFASDADPKLLKIAENDIEDLHMCRSSQANCAETGVSPCINSCGRYKADGCVISHHKWDHVLTSVPLTVITDSRLWLRPTSLQDLQNAVVQNSGCRIKFVVGNTSAGVFKQDNDFDVYIDTKLVPELYKISDTTNNELEIGANVTLSSLISTLKSRSAESVTFDVIAKHLQKIANVPVRNVGSWVGNIMMKYHHSEFPSDAFILLEAYSVKLLIWDSKSRKITTARLAGENGILHMDMTGKVVLSALILKQTQLKTGKLYASSYKIMPRSQNAHAYVNAAFFANVDKGKVVKSISLVFGGISKTFVHAVQTEIYMIGKDVNLQKTLSGALEILKKEVIPEIYSVLDSSVKYRKSLALGLFYKFYLTLCDQGTVSSLNASASSDLPRPVTTGSQNYSSNASMYPVSQPMPKLTALKQASGEAKYISDFSPLSDELFATFVTSKLANADIDEIQIDTALDLPGVVAIITAADIPSKLKNTYLPPPNVTQPIIADTHVDFAGQPLAIVVADNRVNARKAAEAVAVTYKNQKPGIYNMQTGIENHSFFEGAGDPVVVGDVASAKEESDHVISGTVNIGAQYHFYMETQACRVLPTEDGFDIESATQFQSAILEALSYIFNWDCNRFNIITGRIGGAYGGKATNSIICAAGATVASYITGKPVRIQPGFSECMETYGRRPAYVANYTVGFDADGMLKCIEGTYYSDSGVSSNDSDVTQDTIRQFADSGYHCDNWKLTPKWVKTNVTSTTSCRSPVSAQLCFIMEIMMEHIASYLKQDPIKIKLMNLYKKGQLNLYREPLAYCSLRNICETLTSSAEVGKRKQEINAFNAANKWKKRGLGFTPIKFGMLWNGVNYSNQVSIFYTDGSVILSSAGTEAGQGINTKLIQVASFVLGAPMDLIRVKETTSLRSPNSGPSGGSLTSELNCKGILECCKILKGRLDSIKEKNNMSATISWPDLIKHSYKAGANLTAQYWVFSNSQTKIQYSNYGSAVSEVELDILTGEHVIRRVDILYDCGQSINPDIDIGQVEGAFLMGIGMCTSERIVHDPQTGKLLTNSTWEYKPPASKDIPSIWNVTLLKDAPCPTGILSSKACGEPPLLSSVSVVFAIKRCMEAFRKDKSYFPIDLPATVDSVQQLCQIDISDYTL